MGMGFVSAGAYGRTGGDLYRLSWAGPSYMVPDSSGLAGGESSKRDVLPLAQSSSQGGSTATTGSSNLGFDPAQEGC